VIRLLFLALVACGNRNTTPPPQTPADVPEARPIAAPDAPAPVTSSTSEMPPGPSGTADVEELLRARHAEDLPDRASLEVHGDAVAILGHLAAHAETMQVRARAYDLLGLYETDPTLVAALEDDALHGKLRAAAALGLGRRGLALDARKPARDALYAALGSADERLALTALEVLAAQPATAATLDAALPADGTLRARWKELQ
jgi:hypothetical protein